MKADPLILQLPPPFNYYRLISDSDHLHFGFWPPDDPDQTVEGAQEGMFEKLVSYLPEPPAKILDVGCGLGLSADILNSKGFDVIAISPSPELIEYAIQQYGSGGADFRVLDYFDNDASIFAEGSYDVVFFQESLQYLDPLDAVMSKARLLLKEKGLVIIGDEVCYDKNIKPETSVHMSQAIYTALAENGFLIVENQEVGKYAAPTCNFVIRALTRKLAGSDPIFNDPETRKEALFLLNGWKKQKDWYSEGEFGYEIFVAKKDEFYLRSYKSGDEKKILEGFNEIFNTDRNFDHWYWKFRDNPYGSLMVCMGVSEEGDIISHFAGYPVPFCSTIEKSKKPKCFTTLQAGDTFTHPKVRRKGLGKRGILARSAYYYYAKFLEGVVPFAYGFNAGNVKKLGERFLGYTYIDPVPYWVKGVSRTSFESPSLFSRFFAGFSVEEVDSVDDEWDSLFARLCPTYKFLIKRDAAYVKWRYLDCPDRTYRIFAIRKRGLLVGWGTFIRKNNALIWGDALFDSRCLESANRLLHILLEEYFSGVETIEGWFSQNPRWWSDHLKSIGFAVGKDPNGLTFCYVPYRNKILDNDLLGEKFSNYFYYTWGDSDLF